MTEDEFYKSRAIRDFEEFKKVPDVVEANRLSNDLRDAKNKVIRGICLVGIRKNSYV